MKKIYFTLALAFTALCANTAKAQSGNCGNYGDGSGVTWTLTGLPPNYTLTINGNNEDVIRNQMADYNNGANRPPYYTYRNQITSIVIKNVYGIGKYAFADMGSVQSVELPSSLYVIFNMAFGGCTALQSLTVYAETPPTLVGSVFDLIPRNTLTVNVPCGAISAYQNVYNGTLPPNGWGYDSPQYSVFSNYAEIVPATVPALSNDNALGGVLTLDSVLTVSKRVLAYAKAGNRFVAWSDGNTDNPRTLPVVCGASYTALFDNPDDQIAALETQISDLQTALDDCENGIITSAPEPAPAARHAIAYYNTLGEKLAKAPDTGVYIIIYDDGKAEKVVK